MAAAAIITADIVNFTQLSPKQQKKLIGSLTRLLQPGHIEFYRGDSFQVHVAKPELALELIMKCRCIARSYSSTTDVRASIGIGAVSPNIKKLSTSSDPAFVLSGRSFDEMGKTDSRLAIVTEDHVQNRGLRLAALFADHLFRRLTVKQAEVVYELLSGFNQQVAAKRLKKSQPTVNKHLQAAGWSDITKLISSYTDIILNR